MRAEPVATTEQVRGYALRVWEWPAAGDVERTLVLIHATGFHSRTWDWVVGLLPNSWLVFALDMRGHGGSQAPPDHASTDWREMSADVNAWLEQRDLEDVVAAGHSMGGCVCVLAAASGERIESLALIDPVLVNPNAPQPQASDDAVDSLPPGTLAEMTRKRRRVWPGPQEMADSLEGRGAFTHWPREVLEAYVRHGLKPTKVDDEWVLSCEPEVEAWCYEHAATVDPWPEMAQVSQPVLILRPGVSDGRGPPTDMQAVDVFPNGFQEVVADSGHFIPMQRPDAVADAILTVARDCSED